MSSKLKKAMASVVLAVTVLTGGATAAYAATVYYKGTAVYWDYGRWLGAWSYSDVQSSYYDHLATANGNSSGWKSPGVLAQAKKFIGTGSAEAYWSCRG